MTTIRPAAALLALLLAGAFAGCAADAEPVPTTTETVTVEPTEPAAPALC